jgi:hypothetical protein
MVSSSFDFGNSKVRILTVILVSGVIWTFVINSAVHNPPVENHGSESTNLRKVDKAETKTSTSSGEWTPEVMRRKVQEAAASLEAAVNKPVDANKAEVARGVGIYFPAHDKNQENELKSILLSIAVMRTMQPDSFKTDLLVFSPPRGFEFAKSIGCVMEKRTSFADSERCVIVEHVPMSERPGVTDPVISYSRYLDSILHFAEYKDFEGYDLLMRSDMDTFLTPGFADWRLPSGKVIAVGRGGYSHSNADRRLGFIMRETLGLKTAGKTNIGSTWYATPEVMVAACMLSVASMRWLDRMEFTEYERTQLTTDMWPVWYWPVLALYGGHISINQIAPEKVVYQQDNVMEMDYGSTSKDDLRPAVKHIHCWHTDEFFSKFAFAVGKYNAMDLTEYGDMRSSRAYAGVIAMSAVRLSLAELSEITNDPERMKAGEWKRLLP